ncbi:UNVERIFIED_CONTAM: hypothetical protein FKN15_039378 [Acipenser sinensis]
MAERAVKTAKEILKQADPCLALLSYRSTPTEPTQESPARLLMGRRIRTTVPTLKQNLIPEWPDLNVVRQNDTKAKQSYEKYYNRKHSTRPLPQLSIGDRVRVKTDGEREWKTTGIVRGRCTTPRSYIVQTERGDTPRRNRRHIQLVNKERECSPTIEEHAIPEEIQSSSSLSPRRAETAQESNSRKDTLDSPRPVPEEFVTTRSGRIVKPVQRLDI